MGLAITERCPWILVADPLGTAEQTLATAVLDKKCTENQNIYFLLFTLQECLRKRATSLRYSALLHVHTVATAHYLIK
jgi:hypothetical protein